MITQSERWGEDRKNKATMIVGLQRQYMVSRDQVLETQENEINLERIVTSKLLE